MLIASGSFCAKHRPYRGSWRKTSKRILARDRYKCATKGCPNTATTVDHIIPTSHGGTDRDGNLRALCRACNSRKGGL